jgi:dTDP-4-amino-4,6-dideoxygalactose transaminase
VDKIQSDKRIHLSLAKMCGEEQKYIREAFETNWVAPLGPNVDGFERDLEKFLGEGKHVVALNSGTAALHLGLLLLGVQHGDTVICPSFTFVASANPVRYLGAHPVFVDSEADSWNMSPYHLEKAIVACLEGGEQRAEGGEQRAEGGERRAEGNLISDIGFSISDLSPHSLAPSPPRPLAPSTLSALRSLPHATCSLPKAIIPVHLYGMPARMDKIMAIAEKYGIPVLEDAAEALGSEYKGRKCGTFGDMACLSFNGNKIITTSGGGALVCSTPEQAAKARFLATQARDQAPHYQHSEMGYNYRMSNICAGIGRGQMTALQSFVERRREIHRFYREALGNIPGVSFLEEPSGDFRSNHWLTCLIIDPEKAGFSREALQQAMEAENIETRPLWKPMHLQPLYSGAPISGDGTSEELFRKGLCLPSSPVLTEEDLIRVVKMFKTLIGTK